MDGSPPCSSVHGFSQTRVLERIASFLLQGIFLTQGSNMRLPRWQADSLPPCHLGHCSVAELCLILWLQHARLLHPSLSLRVCSNSCPFSLWCYLAISSSVVPFSFCLQTFPTSGLFQWVATSSHKVAKILELRLLHQSFQGVFRVDFL